MGAMILPIITVFLACCSNVIFLETVIKEDPGSGNIVTFSQFLFIALEGFIFAADFGRKKSSVPLGNYLYLVVMFFLVSVANNSALNFNISMPLHMIFRSGSLIANLILGIIILKRRYKLSKYIAVAMITLGIIACTIASHQDVKSKTTEEEHASQETSAVLYWAIGIFLLTFALFMSARMGIYQETLQTKYGRHPREAMFYSHALPLPGFLLLSKNIYEHAIIFSNSAPVYIPLLGGIPKLWLYLIFNAVTQYICARSVFTLTSQYSSLSVTLVITLRKFVSLLLSIFYFSNPFTIAHWIGTLFVFTGTLVFIDIASILRYLIKGSKSKVK